VRGGTGGPFPAPGGDNPNSKEDFRQKLPNFSVSVFKLISITVLVSFTRLFLYLYRISIENLFSTSFRVSFIDIKF